MVRISILVITFNTSFIKQIPKNMFQNISNSKFCLILIVIFKFFSLIIFVYPCHKFKISKIGIILTIAYFFFNFWHYYQIFLPFGSHLLVTSKVMQGLVYFHMTTEVFTKFISICSTIWSQRAIHKFLNKMDDLNENILKFS